MENLQIYACKKCGEQPFLVTKYTNGMHCFAYRCLNCHSSTPFSFIKEVVEKNWQKRNKEKRVRRENPNG